MENYGKELILDIYDCKTAPFNRAFLKFFFKELCNLIKMKREKLIFWDYKGDVEGYKKAPIHLKGITVVQFISTSSIVIHTLDDLKRVYLNVFSCKDFDNKVVSEFCINFFKGRIINIIMVNRK